MIHCSPNISCPNNLNFLHSEKYIRRAGIIPFLVDNNNITYMLLGLSKEKNPVWADLGGRVEKNETTLQTAIREFNEEARSVVFIDLDRITKIVITSKNNKTQPDQVILFVQIDPTNYNININNTFINTIPRNKYEDEMSELRWIPFETFVKMDPNTLSRSMQQTQKVLKNFR